MEQVQQTITGHQQGEPVPLASTLPVSGGARNKKVCELVRARPLLVVAPCALLALLAGLTVCGSLLWAKEAHDRHKAQSLVRVNSAACAAQRLVQGAHSAAVAAAGVVQLQGAKWPAAKEDAAALLGMLSPQACTSFFAAGGATGTWPDGCGASRGLDSLASLLGLPPLLLPQSGADDGEAACANANSAAVAAASRQAASTGRPVALMTMASAAAGGEPCSRRVITILQPLYADNVTNTGSAAGSTAAAGADGPSSLEAGTTPGVSAAMNSSRLGSSIPASELDAAMAALLGSCPGCVEAAGRGVLWAFVAVSLDADRLLEAALKGWAQEGIHASKGLVLKEILGPEGASLERLLATTSGSRAAGTGSLGGGRATSQAFQVDGIDQQGAPLTWTWVLYTTYDATDQAGSIALLVIGLFTSVAASAMLLGLLVVKYRQELILQAVMPRALIAQLKNENYGLQQTSRDIEQGPTYCHTTADKMQLIVGELLNGRVPELSDVLLVRTALMHGWDLHKPLNLDSDIRNAAMDADVAEALLQQLHSPPGVHFIAGSSAPHVPLAPGLYPEGSAVAPAVLESDSTGSENEKWSSLPGALGLLMTGSIGSRQRAHSYMVTRRGSGHTQGGSDAASYYSYSHHTLASTTADGGGRTSSARNSAHPLHPVSPPLFSRGGLAVGQLGPEAVFAMSPAGGAGGYLGMSLARHAGLMQLETVDSTGPYNDSDDIIKTIPSTTLDCAPASAGAGAIARTAAAAAHVVRGSETGEITPADETDPETLQAGPLDDALVTIGMQGEAEIAAAVDAAVSHGARLALFPPSSPSVAQLPGGSITAACERRVITSPHSQGDSRSHSRQPRGSNTRFSWSLAPAAAAAATAAVVAATAARPSPEADADTDAAELSGHFAMPAPEPLLALPPLPPHYPYARAHTQPRNEAFSGMPLTEVPSPPRPPPRSSNYTAAAGPPAPRAIVTALAMRVDAAAAAAAAFASPLSHRQQQFEFVEQEGSSAPPTLRASTPRNYQALHGGVVPDPRHELREGTGVDGTRNSGDTARGASPNLRSGSPPWGLWHNNSAPRSAAAAAAATATTGSAGEASARRAAADAGSVGTGSAGAGSAGGGTGRRRSMGSSAGGGRLRQLLTRPWVARRHSSGGVPPSWFTQPERLQQIAAGGPAALLAAAAAAAAAPPGSSAASEGMAAPLRVLPDRSPTGELLPASAPLYMLHSPTGVLPGASALRRDADVPAIALGASRTFSRVSGGAPPPQQQAASMAVAGGGYAGAAPASASSIAALLAPRPAPTVPRTSAPAGPYSAAPVVLRALPAAPAPVPVPPALLDRVERLLADSEHAWQFDAFELSAETRGHALSVLCYYLVHRAGLIARFKIQPAKLARYLQCIEDGYRSANPYHNAIHAADVLHSLHMVLVKGGLVGGYADSLTLLACYLAAATHDYQHTGLNNDFLVATQHPLALRYNDKSPLENHHAAAAMLLLCRRGTDFLSDLPPSEFKTLRKLVIELVLATDMKQHFTIVSQFSSAHSSIAATKITPGRTNSSMLLDTHANLQRTLSSSESIARVAAAAASSKPVPLDDAERLLALQIALKCSDLGHTAASLDVHRRWLERLEEEFFLQGDAEQRAGLPISPLFDRTKQGASKSQVGFYEVVVLPLLRQLAGVFPGTRPLLDNATANYKHWKELQEAQQAAGLHTATSQ